MLVVPTSATCTVPYSGLIHYYYTLVGFLLPPFSKLRRPLFGGPKGPRKFLFGETPFDQILIVRPLFWLVFNVLRPLFSGSKMGETPLAGTVHPNK